MHLYWASRRKLYLLEIVEVAFGMILSVRHFGHPRGGRAAMQPGQHLVHPFGVALYKSLDRTIGRVAHPARDSYKMRLPHRGSAKPHALHAPGDANVEGFHSVIRT